MSHECSEGVGANGRVITYNKHRTVWRLLRIAVFVCTFHGKREEKIHVSNQSNLAKYQGTCTNINHITVHRSTLAHTGVMVLST